MRKREPTMICPGMGDPKQARIWTLEKEVKELVQRIKELEQYKEWAEPQIARPVEQAIIEDTNRQLTEKDAKIASLEQRDAKRWNAFINCARIRLLGWAGADMEGNKKESDDYGKNYVHFCAEFWTNYHPLAVTNPLAKTLITTFADAAIDVAMEKSDAAKT